jgi:hypothetical protein
MLILAAASVAFILALFALGCATPQAKTAADREKCLGACDFRLHTAILAQCNTASYEECPAKESLDARWESCAKECRQ